jgi:TMEM175 potassium channel family protein
MRSRSLMDVVGWEAFLHGVFAISVTLLVLDIRVPPVDSVSNGQDLVNALVAEGPRYVAYVLGFLYVGTYWIATHRSLRLLRGVDHWFLVLGMLYLLLIAAVPFSTGLLSEYIGQGNGLDRVALVIFTAWQLALSILANVELRYAVHDGRLLRPEIDPASLRLFVRVAAMGPVIWVIALLSAIFLPPVVTLVLMGLILILFMVEVPVGSQRGGGEPLPAATEGQA